MFREISKCRICGNSNLETVINLGMQKLTGVFPLPNQEVGEGPLELVKCVAPKNNGGVACGLVQLRHSCDGSEMYGFNYGYRSGLNSSMVKHLTDITSEIKKMIKFESGDIILDIGSNDCTLLKSYGMDDVSYVGMDPTSDKFKDFYPSYVKRIPDFFSAKNFLDLFGKDNKAKVITSIAMFYDLDEPIKFAKDVCEILDDNGIWVFEQSYMPYMIETKSFDTICQEHLEFYSLRQIKWITDATGLKIVGVDFNDVNGGSFRITAAKNDSSYPVFVELDNLLDEEEKKGYNSVEIFKKFYSEIGNTKEKILNFLVDAKKQGKKVIGYGASTKGNVLLQHFGITSDVLPAIAEVNPDKFGHVTPGTNIPIISEEDAKEQKPDYFFVLPWHFKQNILEREQTYIKSSGVKFVFPLPDFEVI